MTRLAVHDLGTGTSRVLENTKINRGLHNSHRHPRFLPDGRRFLFLARGSGTSDSAVMVGSLDGDEPRELMRSETQAEPVSGHLLFVREDTLMARPVEPKSLDFVGPARPLAEGVIFASNRSGPHGLYSKAVAGAGEEESVWTSQDALLSTDISPDGRFVLFDQYTGGAGIDIWMLDRDTGEARPLIQTPPNEAEGRISSDGRWLTFQSYESGLQPIRRQFVGGCSGGQHPAPRRQLARKAGGPLIGSTLAHYRITAAAPAGPRLEHRRSRRRRWPN